MKLKELLNSDDIEMVQLGVEILKEKYPKRKWFYKLKEMAPDISTPKNNLFASKFYINSNMVVINSDTYINLWKLHQITNMPLYNITSNNDQIIYVDAEQGRFKFTLPNQNDDGE